jgi:hypothetical protein
MFCDCCMPGSVQLAPRCLLASTTDSAMCAQGAVAHIPKKWSNVQALFLKTADSVALPIYQMLPSGQQKIATS